ncbi:FAD/NAD(P)-binding protein [Pararhizobium sp.]|uniref:FAD/NAD(P)-binding protein n=1 Tax=Pararhizobium sp. TaxID=1977563 RepID=UPI002725C171|nr:FAD/NAD(P)-binding protein [Pararhizobium sp.]MDO9418153.1 FAD/NAD(P)-binding protein [Pararhizobium sp.]
MTVRALPASPYPKADTLRVAIVGRGFSGMMTAIALMKTVTRPFHLRLFDPQPSVSGGQALASVHSTEILNSRVRDLSVSTGEPEDFTIWLTANARFRETVPAAIPGFGQIFVQKGIFSDYVYQRFSEALAMRTDVSIQLSNDVVTSIKRTASGTFCLQTEDGDELAYDTVFMATGYGDRDQAKKPADVETGMVSNRRLGGPRRVVILGSGLRAVDRVFQLRDGGFTGQITILSRRGFLPQPHTRLSADPVFPPQPMPSQLGGIVRFVRQACAEAEASGNGWQAAMNGLRKRARLLWSSLSPREKRQFNRHLRAIYDSHRNRVPADVHARMERELAGGATDLKRGHVLRRAYGGLVVRWPGQNDEDLLMADDVIDCRCLAPDLSKPAIRTLLDTGLARTDELDLGLAVNAAGEVFPPKGKQTGLFAIGPLGLGSLPDIDLVPEIVTQAYAAAALVEIRYRPQLQAG